MFFMIYSYGMVIFESFDFGLDNVELLCLYI